MGKRENGSGLVVGERGARKPPTRGADPLTNLSFAEICDRVIKNKEGDKTTLLKLVLRNVRDGLQERDEFGLMTPGAVALTRDCLNRKFGRPKETKETIKKSLHLIAEIRVDQAKAAALLTGRNGNGKPRSQVGSPADEPDRGESDDESGVGDDRPASGVQGTEQDPET
jgi:hypothetical protein